MDTPIINYTETARNGDPDAISMLINKALSSKGITATVHLSCGYLDILLTSETQIAKEAANFIKKGIVKLDIESVRAVRVRAKLAGKESIAWNQIFKLKEKFPNVGEPNIHIQHELSSEVKTENEPGRKEHAEKMNFHNRRRKLTKNERIALYFTVPFLIINFFVAAEMTNIGLAIFGLFVSAFLVFYFERDKFWHERILFSVFLLFNFYPVGIYFTWRNKNWARTIAFFLVYVTVNLTFSNAFFPISDDPTPYAEVQQVDTPVTSNVESSNQPDISVGMSQALANSNMNRFVSRNGGSYDCASFPDDPSYQICIYQGKSNFEFHIENGFVEKVF